MLLNYDNDNIFAKILRKEIPSKPLFENQDAYAFYDIAPQAPIHILVIPKGKYISYDDFYCHASASEIINFQACINQVVKQEKISMQEGGSGFRIISNIGVCGGQEVPHFHIHILAGKPLGALIAS